MNQRIKIKIEIDFSHLKEHKLCHILEITLDIISVGTCRADIKTLFTMPCIASSFIYLSTMKTAEQFMKYVQN